MESDIHSNREEKPFVFSSSESDDEWVPPAHGEIKNLALYSLKETFKEVFGITKRN
jgi:hypothetical protein